MGTNFTMTRGNNVTLSGTATLSGDPYELGGCLLWFTAKYRYTDADLDAVFQKSIGSGITITNPTQGLFTVAILPADTLAVAKARTVLVWDLQVQDGSGKVYTLNSGSIVINPDVTNA
jgi:hypothetical protein